MMNDDDKDKDNNSGLLGSLFKNIWSPTQNRSTEEKEALERAKAEKKVLDELKEDLSRYYSHNDFFAEAVKGYYSTPASLNKLKNILEEYYFINKGKNEPEFSLTQILLDSDKDLSNNLCYKDEGGKSLRFVYPRNTLPPDPDVEKAIREGGEAYEPEWLDTLLNHMRQVK